MKPAIFIASPEDKANAKEVCDRVIDIIDNSSEEVLFKAYIMQMLLEGFEETFNINIKNGVSVTEKGDDEE